MQQNKFSLVVALLLVPLACLAQMPGPLPSPGGRPVQSPPVLQAAPPAVNAAVSENLGLTTDTPPVDEDEPRDPFWPVGHVSQREKEALQAQEVINTTAEEEVKQAEVDEPHAQAIQIANLSREDQEIIRSQLQIDGFMRFGAKNVVTINGNILQKGDTVTAQLREQTFHFSILGIEADKVILEPIKKPTDVSED